jgi:4-amino-4-deoxy-L-arabinose transferase-like glycosyltransferase
MIKGVRVRSRWILVCLFAFSAALYVGTAGSPALGDEDVDAAHAMVAQEMLQRGDFVVPYMDGLRYLIRPPMHFWLVAASYKLLGESEFATRLPLALAMIGMVLLTFEFGRRFFSRRAGVYAALAVATNLGMFIFTRTMIPEAIYALAFEGIFYLFLRSWTGSLDPRIGYWGAAALCAIAVLTRALIGLLFPAMAIVAFLSFTRGWKRWRELRVFSGACVFLAIAAPWHILAGLRTPGFFWAYFVNEHINRALGTRIPHDYAAVPLGLWWAAHLVWLFPWIFFLPLALRNVRLPPRDGAGTAQWTAREQARLLLFAWAGVILLFFTIESGSRMEYYSFGAWPAICLLIGAGIAEAERTHHTWLRAIQRMLAGTAVALAGLAAYFVYVSVQVRAVGDVASRLDVHSPEKYETSMAHLFDLTPQSMADLRVPLIVSAASILIAFVAAWILRERRFKGLPNVALALGMAGFILAAEMAYGVLNPALSSRSLAYKIEPYLRPVDQIALYGDIRVAPGVAFYSHRNVLLYDARESNLRFGSRYPDAPKRFYDDKDFSELWKGPARVFLVVPEEEERDARAHLPRNSVWELAESGGKAVYINQPLTTADIRPTPAARATLFASSKTVLGSFEFPRTVQNLPPQR